MKFKQQHQTLLQTSAYCAAEKQAHSRINSGSIMHKSLGMDALKIFESGDPTTKGLKGSSLVSNRSDCGMLVPVSQAAGINDAYNDSVEINLKSLEGLNSTKSLAE